MEIHQLSPHFFFTFKISAQNWKKQQKNIKNRTFSYETYSFIGPNPFKNYYFYPPKSLEWSPNSSWHNLDFFIFGQNLHYFELFQMGFSKIVKDCQKRTPKPKQMAMIWRKNLNFSVFIKKTCHKNFHTTYLKITSVGRS